MLLVGILNSDGDFVRQIQPEFAEHLTWPADHPPAVVWCAVPLRRVAEDRPRVARAQCAHDDVMNSWCVGEDLERGEVAGCAETGGLHPIDADLLTGRHRFGEGELFELRI